VFGVRLGLVTLPVVLPEGTTGREKLPVVERVGAWLLGLGRTVVGAPGRAEGIVLGRTTWLEPREGLGVADGRETLPPLEGRE